MRATVAPRSASEPELDLDPVDLPDLTGYSLSRAIRFAAELPMGEAGRLDGLEGEVSRELARRTGRSPRGFYVPWNVPIQSRAGFDTAAGSGAIPTILSPTLIDLLRSKSVLAALGASTVPNLAGGKFAFPKRTATVSIGWFAEGAGPPATSEPRVDTTVLLSPKTTGSFVDITNKAYVSIPRCGDLVAEDLVAAIGTEIDRVGLQGAGGVSNEPLGLLGMAGVPTVPDAAPARSTLIDMERVLGNNNGDIGTLGWVMNPDGRAALRSTEVSTGSGRFLWPDGSRGPLDLPAGVTTHSPDGSLVLGDWSSLLIGLWGPVDVLVDPYRLSTSGVVRIRALQDVDINARHVESFVKTNLVEP